MVYIYITDDIIHCTSVVLLVLCVYNAVIDPAPVISVSSNIPDYITTDLSTAELTSSSNSSPSTTLTTTHSPTTSLIPAIPTTTTDIATTLLSEFNPFPEW